MAAVDFEVFVQHVDHVLDPEDGTQRLVLAHEAEADQSVPLCEVDGGGRVFGFNAHDGALDFGWRLETVATDLDQVVNARQQLNIDRQTAVEVATGPGH